MNQVVNDQRPTGGPGASEPAVRAPAPVPDVLAIAGACTLEQADETRQRVAERLRPGSRLTLDLSAVAEADLSLVQILLAARRSAVEHGASLVLLPGASPAVAALVAAAGLTADAAERAFWEGTPS